MKFIIYILSILFPFLSFATGITPDSIIINESETQIIERQEFDNLIEEITESDSEDMDFQTLANPYPVTRNNRNPYKFRVTQLIATAALIGIGAAGLSSNWMKAINRDIKHDLQNPRHPRLRIDDVVQYTPITLTYLLRLCGVKGMHDYIDMTIISATAYALTSIAVHCIKPMAHELRPNGFDFRSFPSGHTATVFTGAEILRREYWHVSPWIGIAGYVIAAGTGFLRMYNNNHWFTDVLAGAGIGILCAQAAYWLYPVLAKTIFKKRSKKNMFVAAPSISREVKGLALQMTF